jgi:hypothetical protein
VISSRLRINRSPPWATGPSRVMTDSINMTPLKML